VGTEPDQLMQLYSLRHCQLTLTVLDGESRQIRVSVQDVSGRKVLIAVNEHLKTGAAVSLNWNGNLILAEVQGAHIYNDKVCFILKARHFVRVCCTECERLLHSYDRCRKIHINLLKGARGETCDPIDALESSRNECQAVRLKLLTHSFSHRTSHSSGDSMAS
jgi:hypothetical protein